MPLPFVSGLGRMASSVSGAWILFWENSLKAYYLHECFLKWWYPQNTPKMINFSRKTMVVEYHHFRKPPHMNSYHKCFFLTFFFQGTLPKPSFCHCCWYCWWFRNPANSPVDMVSRPLFGRVLYILCRWLALGFLNHQQIPPSKPTNGWTCICSVWKFQPGPFYVDRWGWLNPLKKNTWTHHSKKVTSRIARELLDLLIDLEWFPGSRCHHQSFCESFLRHHQFLLRIPFLTSIGRLYLRPTIGSLRLRSASAADLSIRLRQTQLIQQEICSIFLRMARMDVVLDGFVDGSIGDQTNGLVITYLYQVIQSVTKLHPRSLEVTNNPLKGSWAHHPKKVTLNHQVYGVHWGYNPLILTF